ncbi:hypothetical protein C8R46DRAFT_1344105 [Mycena filopes]|nr:hypothetical protein C8R46DRAFT_1344105 [Mycena filopes]
MAGANYMGGKRNAARARSKDATGRAHKNFFGRQRLDILSKGLSGRVPSGGSSSGLGPRITASDIALSHAKHLVPPLDREEVVFNSNTTPSVPTHLTNPTPSHMGSSSGSRSRILEALDTTEPVAMRAAMNKILSFPDLAGLSTQPRSPPRRTKRPCSDISYPSKREPKRQKTRISPSPSLSNDHNFEELRHEPMDDFALDASLQRPQTPLRAEPTADKENQPESPFILYEGRSPSLPRSPSHPAVASASRLASFSLDPLPKLPSQLTETACTAVTDNLYNYQDPWNAIGHILGLEDPQQSAKPMSQHPFDFFSCESLTTGTDETALNADVDSTQIPCLADAASPSSQIDSHDSTHIHHTSSHDGNPREVDPRETTLERDGQDVELEPLVHYSSDEYNPSLADEQSPSRAHSVPGISSNFLSPLAVSPTSSPPPLNPEFRDGPRFPKFPKFPTHHNLHSPPDAIWRFRTTPLPPRSQGSFESSSSSSPPCVPPELPRLAPPPPAAISHIGTIQPPPPPRLPQNSFKLAPPPCAPPNLLRSASRSPASVVAPMRADDEPDPRPPAEPRKQPIFKLARDEYPEPKMAVINTDAGGCKPERVEKLFCSPGSSGGGGGIGIGIVSTSESDVREKFFGDLCLFADDADDAPESDD